MGKSKLYLRLTLKSEESKRTIEEWNGRDSDELCGFTSREISTFKYYLSVHEVKPDFSPILDKKILIKNFVKGLESSITNFDLRDEDLRFNVIESGRFAMYAISEEEFNLLAKELNRYGEIVIVLNRGMGGLSIDGIASTVTSSDDTVEVYNDSDFIDIYRFVQTLDIIESKEWDDRYLK